MEKIPFVTENFNQHKFVLEKTIKNNVEKIIFISSVLTKVIKNNSIIFWCGNGGSASDSQHLAAELIGRFKNDRRPLKSISLNSDTSVMTCISNDYSYEDLFKRQIEGLGSKGDVIIVISTSGESENIIRVLKKAKDLKIYTIAFLGKFGGRAKDIADYSIIIDSQSTARIQEMHILIGHIIVDLIEKELGYD